MLHTRTYRFRIGKQQDAFEFYTCLLDHVHMQLSPKNKVKKPDDEGSSLVYSIFGTRVGQQVSRAVELFPDFRSW